MIINTINSEMIQGTSTTKYTVPLPYIGLSENDSKRYTNFEICEGKNHINLKKKNGSKKPRKLC